MKILVMTQYYPPEPGAPSNRLSAYVEAMTGRGHDVTVICEFPNYPSGVLSKEDRGRLFRVEHKGSCRVIRTFVLAFAKKNNVKRVLYYFSFAVSSFLAGMMVRRHDIVFSSSPPIFHVYGAMIIARIKRSRLVLDIRDLWPDSVPAFDAMHNDKLMKWAGHIEKQLYRHAAAIFTVSRGIKAKIESRGGLGKAHIVYNGTTEEMFKYEGDIAGFRNRVGWDGKFVILYAGIIGLGQHLFGLLSEIEAVSTDDILFVFVGEGPEKNSMIGEIQKSRIANVRFTDLVPRQEIIAYTSAADVMMVILRESEFFTSAIPSKFFDSMAAGKPVLTNVGGELREMMEEYRTGIYFSLNDKGSFAKAIDILKKDSRLRQELGENGRNMVRAKFIRKNLADEAVRIIEKL